MYYGGWSYLEVYNVPVWQRKWFLERIIREINTASDKGGNESKAAHMNTPDVRQMQERQRAQVPAKLRRFT